MVTDEFFNWLLPLLFLFAAITGSTGEPLVFFSPPHSWELADPKTLSPSIQVAFIGKGASLNLAVEEVDCSLKEYLKDVKKVHLSQPDVKWRDLGKFTMKAGEGRLTEISSSSPWGEVKILQAILVREKKAYILTASCLKNEFPALHSTLLESFQSLTYSTDLFSSIPDSEQRDNLAAFFGLLGHISSETTAEAKKQKQWEDLQKMVIEGCAQMGSHWQYLVLKEGYAKIYPSDHAVQ